MIKNFFPRSGWIILALLFLLYSSHSNAQQSNSQVGKELLLQDSVFFHAIFKTCNTAIIEKTLSSDFEFYQDPGGGNKSTVIGKKQYVENIRTNFCNTNAPKMRREIVKESLQVSLLDNYGALQTGIQRFFLSAGTEGEKLVETSRFSRIWKKTNGAWQLQKESDFIIKDETVPAVAGNYVPDDKQLYNTIVRLDSILFDAYDNCKLDVSEAMYSDSIEFYHDRGGLMTSKKELIEALKNNICGKVTRRLVKGSIEVYPIGNWGAVELGVHGFDNKLEPNAPKSTAKFIIIWQKKNEKWYVSRVVSLH